MIIWNSAKIIFIGIIIYLYYIYVIVLCKNAVK